MEGERGQEETATASPPPEQAKDVRRWRERGCVCVTWLSLCMCLRLFAVASSFSLSAKEHAYPCFLLSLCIPGGNL